MKISILAIGLMAATTLKAEDFKVSEIPQSLGKMSSMKTKVALPALGQIEDALHEYKSENPTSKEWNALLAASLPEVMALHSKFQENDRLGRAPASAKSLEDCEFRDRIESLALWMMKEMSSDVALRLMSHSGNEVALSSLVYFLSRECEMSAQMCRKEILSQASNSYKNSAKNVDLFVLARAEVFGGETMNAALNDEKSMLADLNFGIPLRGISSSDKPATAVVPSNE
jgi:hypothetical protein